MNAAICGIDDRCLCADHHRLANGAYFESDGHIQILFGEKCDVRLRFRETGRFGRDFVSPRGNTNETIVAGFIAGRNRGAASRDVHQMDGGLTDPRASRVLNNPLDTSGELSKSCDRGQQENRAQPHRTTKQHASWHGCLQMISRRPVLGAQRQKTFTGAQ